MKYGFIGCGNMGGAIARAVSKRTRDIAVSDRSGKAKALAAELGVRYADNAEIAGSCERVFLAVKPQMMRDCIAGIRRYLILRRPLLITMAAGLEIARIEEFVGMSLPVIRIMPNTPTAIGRGVIQYCRNDLVDDAVLADWLEDMRFCGELDALDEKLIDAASALSGSGPAYAYIFLEALADGAVACGIPRDKALRYAAHTLIGAAELMLNTGSHPGALKDAVCSPGGSTIAGVRALEQHGFRAAVMDCVYAAWQKNRELGK
jgi:pyrroline-5-carboxylate reductase